MSDPIGEPFVDDWRLEKAVNRVRQAIPDLPHDTEFVTYIQPRQWKNHNGVDIEIPDTAVFTVASPNPRNQAFRLVDRGVELFANWRLREKAYNHNPGQVDPLVPLFTQVAKSHMSKLRNLRAML